jgi:hypothetical protein
VTPAELHAWLVARWQEKLDTARAATPGPWEALAQNSDGQNTVLSRGPRDGEKATGTFKAVWLEVQSHDGNWNINLDRQTADADHIAAFDPAFAIAVCEATLRRLERHRPLLDTRGCQGRAVGPAIRSSMRSRTGRAPRSSTTPRRSPAGPTSRRS